MPFGCSHQQSGSHYPHQTDLCLFLKIHFCHIFCNSLELVACDCLLIKLDVLCHAMCYYFQNLISDFRFGILIIVAVFSRKSFLKDLTFITTLLKRWHCLHNHIHFRCFPESSNTGSTWPVPQGMNHTSRLHGQHTFLFCWTPTVCTPAPAGASAPTNSPYPDLGSV